MNTAHNLSTIAIAVLIAALSVTAMLIISPFNQAGYVGHSTAMISLELPIAPVGQTAQHSQPTTHTLRTDNANPGYFGNNWNPMIGYNPYWLVK